MAIKTHATGFRLGRIRGWDANWIATTKKVPALLREDFTIRAYIHKKLPKDVIARVVIARDIKSTTVTIHTSKPGVLIGAKGAKIAEATQALKKVVQGNLQLNVSEIKVPELDAQLVARSIAAQIENNSHYKRVVKYAISSTIRAGAQGIEVWIGGRLAGAEIARQEKYKEGRIPRHTIRADIGYASEPAHTTYGVIGIKVWIFKREVYGARDLSRNIEVVPSKREDFRSHPNTRRPRTNQR
jgi:small subunit ribosomal protein S3